MKKKSVKKNLREQAIDSIWGVLDEVISDVKDCNESSYFVQPDGKIVSNDGSSTLCLNDEPLEQVLYLDGSDWTSEIPYSEKEDEDYDEDDYFDPDGTLDSYYSDLMETAISQIDEGYFEDEEEV